VSGRGVRWSVAALALLTLVCLLVGFVWLPSAQADFTAKGLWDSICRAAGVPSQWGDATPGRAAVRSTGVVLDASMAAAGASDAVGRGASLALAQCTMCHGPQGMTQSNAPNLAGQYSDVVLKQLLDYRKGDRASPIMQALSEALSERDMHDLAAYFASLPKPRNAPERDLGKAPALVKTGDPMRNVAPCASCHGGIDRKIGAPWLEGMPREYLAAQLAAFASGQRRNDSHRQMRNVAHAMTEREIADVADFYARHVENKGEQK
jgi:cytochrome c553